MSARKDGQLLKRVHEALDRLALTGDCELEVFVQEGVAEIAGTVPTRSRKAEIVEAARRVPELEGLEYEIHVLREGDSEALDEEDPLAESRVEELILEDPRFLNESEGTFS